MYEFIDDSGGRNTIRSARTLNRLLLDGRIRADTRFRLSDEPDFRAADTHPSLLEAALQAGVDLGPPRPPPATPVVTSPQPQVAPAPEPGVPAVPVPRLAAKPVHPTTTGPVGRPQASVPGAAGLPATTLTARPVRVEPRAAESAAGSRAATGREGTFPRQVVAVFAALLGALALGCIAGLVAAGATGNATMGWLVAVAGASWLANLAGRNLGQRIPPITGVQAGIGTAVFLAGCLLAGWSGLIVGLPTSYVLWTALRGRRA